MTTFDLHPRLEGDSFPICDLALCTVRLIKDANYPWLLLVPRKNNLIEIIDLDESDQLQLMREIALASETLREITKAEKLNVAALGNQVSQLHVHVIGRFRHDAAWPGPVWGAVPFKEYEKPAASDLIERIRDHLPG
ncbi:diadenosine tetraphosphate (Ap4A) HIT family hydrolase [Roseibium hamelinense]|uniref:Diadenosine tetraphosphate (Ap4A) HIT family hydrolase n=1 Tax=Roseibium hamelinense TaxID=150831 RepID=A0A562T1S9_9HYPH|nr:HIT family protein [Roseibium hamelinense]MTI44636.1 HIT family protein [Roseibium hamelinense]TWI87263.1 diadenosine tetraphosphate (Ap4A) HIT family hydrolase [Roseibium hamelinense]